MELTKVLLGFLSLCPVALAGQDYTATVKVHNNSTLLIQDILVEHKHDKIYKAKRVFSNLAPGAITQDSLTVEYRIETMIQGSDFWKATWISHNSTNITTTDPVNFNGLKDTLRKGANDWGPFGGFIAGGVVGPKIVKGMGSKIVKGLKPSKRSLKTIFVGGYRLLEDGISGLGRLFKKPKTVATAAESQGAKLADDAGRAAGMLDDAGRVATTSADDASRAAAPAAAEAAEDAGKVVSTADDASKGAANAAGATEDAAKKGNWKTELGDQVISTGSGIAGAMGAQALNAGLTNTEVTLGFLKHDLTPEDSLKDVMIVIQNDGTVDVVSTATNRISTTGISSKRPSTAMLESFAATKAAQYKVVRRFVA